MKKKLFGSLGESVKGNAVLIILSVCVIAVGALSYYTVNDINTKLKNQQVKQPAPTATPMPTEQPVQDVQNNAENVPLQPTTSPEVSPKVSPEKETEVPVTDQPAVGFTIPVEGEIYNAFSRDELVYNKSMNDWRTHNGVDIKATKDTAVKAGTAGKVTNVYQDGVLGYVVEVESAEYTVRYCGLGSNVLVKKGDSVSQGQSLGVIGELPLEISDDSHLHLEFLKNGQYQDPAQYLR